MGRYVGMRSILHASGLVRRSIAAMGLLLVSQGSAMAQQLGDDYWDRIVDRADSVVIARFGADFFLDHIFEPMYPMDYILFGDTHCSWEDRDTVTTIPSQCYFEYDIGFDTLHVGRMNIHFSITPDGRLIEDEDLSGFVASAPPIAFYTDLDGFVQLARENGVRCSRKDAFRALYWIPADTAARIHPGGIGHYELILGRVGKKKEKQVEGSTWYYQVVDAIVFDPFTGAVLRKEQLNESLGWACGVWRL